MITLRLKQESQARTRRPRLDFDGVSAAISMNEPLLSRRQAETGRMKDGHRIKKEIPADYAGTETP